LVRSALANAGDVSAHDLVIEKIEVNGGVIFRRSMPRARGRASAIKKKSSHVTIALGQKKEKKAKN
jgi:large subunit ribosomal protein L22